MAKKARKKKQTATANKGTNWYVIGGIGGLGILFLAAMMYLAVKPPAAPEEFSLIGYCDDNPDACISMGDKNAPVTIVEVSDYGCGHCRNFNADTAPLLEQQFVDTGIVRYVSLPFSLGPATLIGANAAMCANDQGAYFEYQTALFSESGEPDFLTPDGVTGVATDLGLDGAAFDACLSSGKYAGSVTDNVAAAQKAGVAATPSFFINGRLVEGNNPIENFANFIAQAQQEG